MPALDAAQTAPPPAFPAPLADSPAAPAPERRPVDILIVDDNPGKILALETALAPLGENLVTASSGREALRQLLTRQFATVILDVNMPDMDGFETAQMMRSRSRSAHTPIIFVSAINMDGTDALRGYALGAVDYIFAPLIPEVLRAKVSVFVDLYRKSEEAKLHAQRLEERTRELERSQQALRLAERMASIGTLCAGLGHDMGNLLLPIMARLETTDLSTLPKDHRENLESIRTCVAYLQRLSNGLRLLSLDPDGRDASDESTDLALWWTDVAPMLRNALPRGISLEAEIPACSPVRIPRHALTQAVFNLVQNAGEALRARGQGTVRVWARPEPAPSPHALPPDAQPPQPTVRIGVTDNGPGMEPEVLRRCFDPFFTTKTRSISTGLGLALVNGIVQKAGGVIEVASVRAEGTTFSFALKAAAPAQPGGAKPLVLLSLKDLRIRGFAASVLKSAGFDVRAADAELKPDALAAASLWVLDPDDPLMDRTADFLDGDNARRVLVFGEPPPDSPIASTILPATTPATTAESEGQVRGIVGFSAPPRPTVLLDWLREWRELYATP